MSVEFLPSVHSQSKLAEIILLIGTVPGYYPPIFLINRMGRTQNTNE